MPSRSVSIETPVHVVSSFDHFVTQWMSTVIRSRGSAWNCSHVQDLGSSTSPRISNVHASSGWWGVGPGGGRGEGRRPGGEDGEVARQVLAGRETRRLGGVLPTPTESTRDRRHQTGVVT